MPRFITMHKSDASTEAGVLPTPEFMERMGNYIGGVAATGNLLAGEGLRPSSEGVRLNFRGGELSVTKGPFTGDHGVPAGFSITRAASLDEAIDQTRDFAKLSGDVEIDIRPVVETWDLGLEPKPEGLTTRRYMAISKADAKTEAGTPPTPEEMKAMGELIERGFSEGWLLSAEGFPPSSQAVRLQYSGGRKKVIDGPFAESKEVIAGYAILKANSMEEMIRNTDGFAALFPEVEIDIFPLFDWSESRAG
jgi:hypothetical protein